jgi:hypothetical protein
MSNVYFQVLKHHADAIQRMYKVRWVPQKHHFKMCKQLMESEVEGFEPYTPEEIIERLEAYYKEIWWRTTRHDFANFCKHFDKFIVKVEERTTGHQGKWEPVKEKLSLVVPMIHCERCNKNHSVDFDCYSEGTIGKAM